ncbi:hypothetical protein [Cellulomonas aerilata]|uniref:Uncharacterized protein n=1 Tax=Cellulomonas aerilata TaxID=515326 RepID=A0A512DE70_9CELL|nr:hypothetical protein [Cellulomonas aerilata]GEO34776.1 hypothetical protein CAE01nite_25010 [Cellulomonas aerilata]
MLTSQRWRRCVAFVCAALIAPLAVVGLAGPAQAKKGGACDGAGWSIVNLATGSTVVAGTDVERTVSADLLGPGTFGVRGRYVGYDVRLTDFAVLDYGFTGAASRADMTGGRPTPVFASKVPDHRGLSLSSAVEITLDDEVLELGRSGSGLSMKIQSKDCAQGGIFQMEPERGDGTATRITHTLATSADPALQPFYFDNPRFRARVGEFLGSACTSALTGPPSQFCVQVSTRVNIANDFSPAFVARDSAQVADRVPQPECTTAVPVEPSVQHCGGVSVWDVASGGRMGFVSGEDAVEVANPPTECVSDCQAQNQVRGRLAVLGFPFPVPDGSRLVPRTASAALPPLVP